MIDLDVSLPFRVRLHSEVLCCFCAADAGEAELVETVYHGTEAPAVRCVDVAECARRRYLARRRDERQRPATAACAKSPQRPV